MADRTDIEWTDSTWNPIRAALRNMRRHVDSGRARPGWHCEHVSPGCANCYAGSINRRLGTGLEYKPGHRNELEIYVDEKALLAPLRWKKPGMIFVCSMTDLFADFVTDDMIDRVFAVMALCPQHTFQVLTKRASRMREYVGALGASDWKARLGDTRKVSLAAPTGRYPAWPLPNVWLGVSAEDQKNANERIPDLLATPAAIRFVSLEPLLEEIDLRNMPLEQCREALRAPAHHDRFDALHPHNWARLDWVITGGESGPKSRPMHPDWPRKIRDDCAAAGVPFFFKQWGGFVPHYGDVTQERVAVCKHGSATFTIAPNERARQFDLLDRCQMIRVGKKRAGRLLDGVEHNGMPR